MFLPGPSSAVDPSTRRRPFSPTRVSWCHGRHSPKFIRPLAHCFRAKQLASARHRIKTGNIRITGDCLSKLVAKMNSAIGDKVKTFGNFTVKGWTWTTNLSPNRTRLTEDQFLRLWRLGVTHLIVVSMRRWRRFDKIGVRSHPLRWRAIHRIRRNAIRAEFGISVVEEDEMNRR